MAANKTNMKAGSILNDPDFPSHPFSKLDSNKILSNIMSQQNNTTECTTQDCSIGMSASAPILSKCQKHKRKHDTDPSFKMIYNSNLIAKLKDIIKDLSTCDGLQAVVVMY